MPDARKKLLSVQSIQLGGGNSEDSVSVFVTGLAVTTGWRDIELVPLEKELSSDGILDLEFVGVPPKEPSIQVLTPVSASLLWKGDVKRLVGINVHSRSGAHIHLLPGPGGPQPTTFALGEEGPGPTTMAMGEEGPLPTTFAIGEEGPTPTTMFFGEEGPGPTTLAFGEEGPGPGPGPAPTTLMFGEEGPDPTTLAFGEEGPGPGPTTTLRFGEEGPGPTTFALGEEGPTTFRQGEEGSPKSPFGETDPRTDDPGPGTWFDPGNPNPFGRR